eukprot:TRINITY_DN0_c2339_g1_i1.p1 TRINITY_DN0_c2339_g1~~TRINITY_DN0_c2339_g1_i1.p1  ORF type:complete len:103 (+),score=35.48 TRINITY_DN0_c2339_g1_i1:142-450(+)
MSIQGEASPSQTPSAGGRKGQRKIADQDVQKMVVDVRQTVESRVGKSYMIYQAVFYSDTGAIYRVKVLVDDGEYLHMTLQKNEGSAPSVLAVEQRKGLNDDL